MPKWIANARMYAVAPAAEDAWRAVLIHISEEAGVPLEYLTYAAPLPLDQLWIRPDLGAVLMCGFPIALGLAPVSPIAAPIPSAAWAEGRAVYRTDLVVRADSRFQTLTDTFGGRLGWTVEHSQSGFNALRHHLLRYRSSKSPKLYRDVVGHLITARKVVDSILDGIIDVGPIDGYWHSLFALHYPELAAQLRTVESTEPSAAPAFVASQHLSAEAVKRLCDTFVGAAQRPWFAALAAQIGARGFAPSRRADYDGTLEWQARAQADGYLIPS
jgi:ABC-type phosphate/phosphonate transport system substrate-binding protein